MGDTHVYVTHVEPLKEQLIRTPHPFPILKLNPEVMNIEEFKFEDFELVNYTHEKKIKMEMAV